MPELPDPCTRRNWILGGLIGFVTVTLGEICYPMVRFLWPRKEATSGAQEMAAPFRVNQLPNAEGNPFNFGNRPCLVVLTPDGAKRLSRGERLRPDDVKAFDAICTHVDCTVKYRADKGDIYCSCHNGVYDLNGLNVSGPPPRPLEAYKVTLQGEPGQEEIIVSRST